MPHRAAGTTAIAGDRGHQSVNAVLFDLDNTLITRTTTQLARVVAFLQAHAPQEGTVPPPPVPAMERVLPVPPAMRPLLGAVCDRLRPSIHLTVEAHQVLQALDQAGVPWGIVTNGAPEKHQTLHLLGVDQQTRCLFVSATAGPRKPDTAMFHAAARCLGVPAQHVLFVGDTRRTDIAGARAAGMSTAWLRQGPAWLPRPRHPAADVTLHTLAALLDLIPAQRKAPQHRALLSVLRTITASRRSRPHPSDSRAKRT